MMKRLALILLTATLLPLMAFVKDDVKLKKLNKLVDKIWKNESAELSPINLPDSISSELGLLYEVKINGLTQGYACYATAFGCRIGGCAAPTNNANVQSYETFDYMVIYNQSLQVIKIDIAEYSGQYGYEICRAAWLKQFEGLTSGYKLNENIDGITGATVSAQYLIDDLNYIGDKMIALYSKIKNDSGAISAD